MSGWGKLFPNCLVDDSSLLLIASEVCWLSPSHIQRTTLGLGMNGSKECRLCWSIRGVKPNRFPATLSHSETGASGLPPGFLPTASCHRFFAQVKMPLSVWHSCRSRQPKAIPENVFNKWKWLNSVETDRPLMIIPSFGRGFVESIVIVVVVPVVGPVFGVKRANSEWCFCREYIASNFQRSPSLFGL